MSILQFAVWRVQFQVAGFLIVAGRSTCSYRHVVFSQVKVLQFYRLKTMNNSLIRVQTSN